MLSFKSNDKKKKINKLYFKVTMSDGITKKVKVKYLYFLSNGVKKYIRIGD